MGDGKHDSSENDPRIDMIRVNMDSAVHSSLAKNVLSRVGQVVQGAPRASPPPSAA